MLNYTLEAQEIANKPDEDFDDDDLVFTETLTIPEDFYYEWAHRSSDWSNIEKVFDPESVNKIMDAFDILTQAENMYCHLAPEI